MDSGSPVKEIKRLSGQTRLDRLIELAYSEHRRLISDDVYWNLGFPDHEVASVLRDAANTHETFEWPDSVPPESRTRWKCVFVADVVQLNPDLIDGEFAIDYLENALTDDRAQAILAGATLDDTEWALLKQRYAERNHPGIGFGIVCLITCDREGRELKFVQEVGDWGSVVGQSGPFVEGEDDLSAYRGREFEIVWADDLWDSATPEGEVAHPTG